MKNWILRHKVLCGVVAVFLCLYLWPISLGDRIPEDESLAITWTDLVIVSPAEGETHSSLDIQATQYYLEAGTKERADFQDLLEGYSIHRTWRTPFPANSLGDSNGAYCHIVWHPGGDTALLVTGFTGPILLDGHIYSHHHPLDMMERVAAFLGHCTPVSANES